MSSLEQTKWDKQSLAAAINQRVDSDRQKISGDYIMPNDISDEALENFQVVWESNVMQPLNREAELLKLYQAIIAGF